MAQDVRGDAGGVDPAIQRGLLQQQREALARHRALRIAAWEQPQLLVEELRAGFGSLRDPS